MPIEEAFRRVPRRRSLITF